MSISFFVTFLAFLFSMFVVGALIGALIVSQGDAGEHDHRSHHDPFSRARERLRMLMFGWEFPPFNSGGLGVACAGLARALSKCGLDITFVVPKRLPNGVSYATMLSADIDNVTGLEGIENITIHAINSPVTPYVTRDGYTATQVCWEDGTPIYGNDLISEARRYALMGGRLARCVPHDLIYAHDWLAFGAGCAAKHVSHRPLLAHIHSTEFDRSGGNTVDQRVYDLERTGLHTADRVIAVSNRTRQTVIDHYGVSAERVHAVWNGIDEHTAPAHDAPATEARLAALKRAGYKIVLFLGRITIQKGPDYFIRAAARVAAHEPKAIFVMAGSGDMERQMMHLAASLGIADRVLFPGFLRGRDQYEAYKLADLFVVPSVSEPFGLTALEAMRLGVPTIVSKQSGVAEALTSNFTVDFWDIDKMAEMMRAVLGSPVLRAKLKAQGLADAATLTWDRAAESIREHVDHLFADRAFAPVYL